jgi:hypothetical protein
MSQLFWLHSKLKSWLENASMYQMQIHRSLAMQKLPVYILKLIICCTEKGYQKYTQQTVHNP